jgi:CRISPR-associated protein Cas5h
MATTDPTTDDTANSDDAEGPEAAENGPSAESFEPETCLSFTISAKSAHFRKIEGNSTAQTYKIPPRTTVMGIVAAIIGDDRDTYYDRSRRSNAAYAVIPETGLRTQQMVISEVATNSDSLEKIGPDDEITLPKTGTERHSQRNPYNYLQDVAYRIFIGFDRGAEEGDRAYTELCDRLEAGESVYPVYLGRTDCLATIDYHGECDVSPLSATTIDSAVYGEDPIDHIHMPSAQDMSDSNIGRLTLGLMESERSPSEFERVDEDGSVRRRPLSWDTWTVRRDGMPISLTKEFPASRVVPRTGDETEEDDSGGQVEFTVMFS